MKIRAVYLIYFLCLSLKVYGWWDVPHMLVAQIAKNNIQSSTCDRAEELLAYFKDDFPQSSTFITASCFPDDITTLGLSGFRVWHAMLTPYCPDSTLSENSRHCIEAFVNDNNLISAINQSMKTMKDPFTSKWEKCFLFRFLLHCVGDIHQPLHCIQLYSQQFPKGDLAGHRFHIYHPYRNLHLLWDAAFGIGAKKMMRPLSIEDQIWIENTANKIEILYPQINLAKSENMNFKDWAKESYDLAVNVAYMGIEPGDAPSEEYLHRGQEVALRQIALAGYRLANLIKKFSKIIFI